MSDEPPNRQPDDDRFPFVSSDGRPDDDQAGMAGPPLRTRRDPTARESTRLRPASAQPAWQEDPTRRRRGTGRYAAPVADLAPAVIPEGAPGWMGMSRSQHDGSGSRQPVVPRPLSGAMRHASDYDPRGPVRQEVAPARASSTGTWPSVDGAPPVRRGSTGSWPAPRPPGDTSASQRFALPTDDTGAPPADGEGRLDATNTAVRSGSRATRRTSRDRRSARRPAVAALAEPVTARLVLLVALSAVALWVATWLLISDVAEPLVLRLGADGGPSEVIGAGALWRVPFVATMLGLMSIGVAMLLAGRDRFAARFVVGAGILVQALIWVAAITLLR